MATEELPEEWLLSESLALSMSILVGSAKAADVIRRDREGRS